MNVLLAVDTSPQSQAATNLIQTIQFPVRTRLYPLNVIEPKQWMNALEGKHKLHLQDRLSSARAKETTERWQFLNTQSEALWNSRLEVTPLVTNGIPGGEILSAIEKFEIDLVVLGTHGRTGLKRFLLGSVSEWVLIEAPCSVLIVRGEVRTRMKKPKGLKILIGVDGSPDSEAAIQFIRQLKFPPSSSVTVCHILQEQPALRTELASRFGVTGKAELAKFTAEIHKVREQAGEKLVNSGVKILRSRGRTVRKSLAYGHPADQILALAQRQKFDLVVVGSKGITGLRKFFLGSVSNKVASYSPCSVLVVRKPAKEKESKPHKSNLWGEEE